MLNRRTTERSIIKVVWCQREIRLGIFITTYSFVPHGLYVTPQIKLPTKSSLQHTLGLQTHARNLNKNYCVPTEDVKLLRRNLRACLQEVTSSFRLFKLARSALQMMKYFSHRHKLQRFEAGLNGAAACFKIFQVELNPILASFKCQTCLLSSVLSLLFGSLKEDLWFEYLVLKEFSVRPT